MNYRKHLRKIGWTEKEIEAYEKLMFRVKEVSLEGYQIMRDQADKLALIGNTSYMKTVGSNSILIDAFYWSDSKLGHAFWSNIDKKIDYKAPIVDYKAHLKSLDWSSKAIDQYTLLLEKVWDVDIDAYLIMKYEINTLDVFKDATNIKLFEFVPTLYNAFCWGISDQEFYYWYHIDKQIKYTYTIKEKKVRKYNRDEKGRFSKKKTVTKTQA